MLKIVHSLSRKTITDNESGVIPNIAAMFFVFASIRKFDYKIRNQYMINYNHDKPNFSRMTVSILEIFSKFW